MGGSSEQKVVAVILTHNRLEGAIMRCEEVTRQTRPPDDIVLVDNGSARGIAEQITSRFPQVSVVRLPENLGPAGGFAVGFSEAMRRGCDFVWAIDDDTVVSARCLEALLADAETAPRSVIFPSRLPHHEKHGVAWRAMLVPADVVRSVGVPRADLFWHLEDTEYFIHRIRDVAGYRLIISPKAVVWHGTHRPRKGFPGWKLYYQTRNSIFYRFRLKRSWWRRLLTLLRVAGRLVVIFAREERGPAKAWLMVRGVADGLRGRMGKTVDPQSEPPSTLAGSSPDTREREEAEEAFRRWDADSETRETMLRLWMNDLERQTGA